jgi:hypothetical protein
LREQAQKNSASIEELQVFIQRQLEFCQNISYTAQMYVQVSDKYIMKSTTHVPLELTLALGEHEENKLSKSRTACEEMAVRKDVNG